MAALESDDNRGHFTSVLITFNNSHIFYNL